MPTRLKIRPFSPFRCHGKEKKRLCSRSMEKSCACARLVAEDPAANAPWFHGKTIFRLDPICLFLYFLECSLLLLGFATEQAKCAKISNVWPWNFPHTRKRKTSESLRRQDRLFVGPDILFTCNYYKRAPFFPFLKLLLLQHRTQLSESLLSREHLHSIALCKRTEREREARLNNGP